jgi:integrase
MSYKSTNQTGISKRQLKNKSWVFYASYRDKETQKVKRVKVGGKKEGILDAFDAKVAFKKLQKEKLKQQDEEEQIEYTLNKLSDLYFAHRFKIVREDFILNFKKLITTSVEDDAVYKDKKQAVQVEQNRYNNHIKEHDIAKKLISDIKLKDVIAFKEYIIERESVSNPRFKKAQKPKALSTKTKHLIYSLAKSIWNFGLEQHYIKQDNLLLDRAISKQLKNPKDIRYRILDSEEQNMLIWELEKLKEYNAYYVAKLGLLTGARAKSILGLRRRDISLDDLTITLNNYKTNKTYTIPFSEHYVSFFEAMFEKVKPAENEHIIQPQRKALYKGTALRNIPQEYFEVCNKLFNDGLNMSDNLVRNTKVVSYHTLRHTRLSELANSDVPLHFVKLFANHSSLESTIRYIKSDTEKMREQLDKLSVRAFLDKDYIEPKTDEERQEEVIKAFLADGGTL